MSAEEHPHGDPVEAQGADRDEPRMPEALGREETDADTKPDVVRLVEAGRIEIMAKISDARDCIVALRAEKREFQRRAEAVEKRFAENEAVISRLDKTTESQRKRIRELEAERDRRLAETEGLRSELESLRDEKGAMSQRRDSAEAALEEISTALDALRIDIPQEPAT
jgi:chromosome segregation ATPase